MTTRKNPGRGGSGSAQRIGASPARLRLLLALPAAIAAAAALVACSSAGAGSSTSSPASAAAGTVKTATIGGVTVLTNSKGFTLYSFAPDTSTTSNCNGTCAQNWPPGAGTAAGQRPVTGHVRHDQVRADGSVQATASTGTPLYAYIAVGDTAPGQASGWSRATA